VAGLYADMEGFSGVSLQWNKRARLTTQILPIFSFLLSFGGFLR
jgi:hypothetical protein